MIVTKRHCQRSWQATFTNILVLAVIFYGLAITDVYAAANAQATTGQQETAPPTLTVTLLDEEGVPASGVDLSAIVADFTGRVKGRVTTDENGKAVFRDLTSGTYYFFANINGLRRHEGYGLPVMVGKFKSAASYFISENRKFDLRENVETAFTIKRGAFIWIETYLQVVRSGKIVLINRKAGMQQIIPVASADYLQIYLPMRSLYQAETIKNNDFDAWILEFWAHEGLRLLLL